VGGGTPTQPALEGATQWAAEHMAQHPDEKAVVLMVTDGAPSLCNTNADDIFDLAKNAYQSTGVLTFAIGMYGADQGFLHDLAISGGTNDEFMIDPSGQTTMAQQLIAAMKKIQGTTVSCVTAMPAPPHGKKIDPSQVEVVITSPGGMTAKVTRVADASQCAASGGFYYDDPVKPTQIILCPSSCTAAQSAAGGKFSVNLGCLTDIN